MRTEFEINEICNRLAAVHTNPRTELQYSSHYTFLIAVVMSAQTTDVQVNAVTAKLFAKHNTIDDIIALGVERLQGFIKSIGLYKNKAKNIVALSKLLKEQHNSEVPNNRDALQRLPGVGRKTANVVMNTLFGEPVIAVDTHVMRVSRRLELSSVSSNNNPLKIEQDLERVIPDIHKRHIGNLLVLHGRYTCRARTPLCNQCILKDLCRSCVSVS